LQERDPLAWVMKALREAGNSIVREFAGLGEDALRQRPAEGELCLKEIAAHLRDAEELALKQITCLMETPGRPLPVWDVDVLPMERDYRSADVRELLAEFRSLRSDTTTALWSATRKEWRRPGKHPYKASITLEEIARGLAQHDLEHLWQAQQIKHELGMEKVRVGDDWDDWQEWGSATEDSLP